MYAIIETGGKQYRATPGDVLSFERLDGKKGDAVAFDKILLVAGQNDQVFVGKPYVTAAKVTAEIVTEDRKGVKLLTIKYKRRKQHRRTIGHRQMFTQVLITGIEDGKGGKMEFDNSKRTEVLKKASVKFATREAKTKSASAETSKAAPKAKKSAAAKAPAKTAKKAK